MVAQSQSLDVIANNLANLNTNGFKSSRANFQDMLYQAVQQPGGAWGPNAPGLGVSYGSGTAISSTQLDFTQGPVTSTGGSLDAAINGPGFFVVADGQGNPFFTRAGNFTTNADGQLVLPTASGSFLLQPPITIPPDATGTAIAADGSVTAQVNGQTVFLGQLEAASFANPDGLSPLADNLYAESGASGSPFYGQFGQGGFGALVGGAQEGSNVEVVDEVVNLLTTQRAFELDAESFRAGLQNIQTLLSVANRT
jgi:flagellar basal-body rod protein FlgG